MVGLLLVTCTWLPVDDLDKLITRVDYNHQSDMGKIEKYGHTAFNRIYPMLKEPPKSLENPYIQKRGIWAMCLCRTAVPSDEAKIATLFLASRRHRITLMWEGTQYLGWLSKLPHPNKYRSHFLKYLDEWPSIASKGLAQIGDDAAVSSLVKAIRRCSNRMNIVPLFVGLTSIHRPSADHAMEAFSKGKRLISSFPDRSTLRASNKSGFHIEARIMRANGEKFALVAWDGLDSPKDLWVVHWDGKSWTDPVFTGMTKFWPMGWSEETMKAEEQHEKDFRKLITSGSWVKKFVDNPELSKDSDRDGLPDIVERWIGTDPNTADGDGDGIRDGIDKSPMAKPATTEDDRALITVLTPFSCFRSKANGNLIITYPSSMKPVELDCANGRVLWYPELTERSLHSDALFGHRLSISLPEKISANERSYQVEDDYGSPVISYTVIIKRLGTSWRIVKLKHWGTGFRN